MDSGFIENVGFLNNRILSAHAPCPNSSFLPNLGSNNPAVVEDGLNLIRKTAETVSRFFISLSWDPFILAVSKDLPYTTVETLIEAAQAAPSTITLENAGGGSTAVASNSINLSFNRIFNAVPFSGGGSEKISIHISTALQLPSEML
ncbi:MAG: hypothetical protein B6241_03245 [Spirochaetaceae bacterium 4572_59]|nr:MAG: hypothetical protein B6241_03245 [Spirochaetaceae bacterium 4572_59]